MARLDHCFSPKSLVSPILPIPPHYSVSHIPSGFPLNAFLPLLALLLHYVEPLTTPPDATTMQIDATSKRTLCEVLLVAERMSKSVPCVTKPLS